MKMTRPILWLTLAALLPLASPANEALSEEKQQLIAEVDALESQVGDMSMALWRYAETALREQQSAEYLAGVLQAEGFTVERGVADMPTAFVAHWGSGKPALGILAEYDALPDIGNDPVPQRQPRADGNPHGHGCGHNLFAAGSVAAAIALKRTMADRGIEGTVKLFGSPAEETLVGKVYMANAGVFEGIDISIDWHPLQETSVVNETGQAMNNFQVEFFGRPAHGAFDPWNGRSALDAVMLMNHAADMMREHIEPSARIHYVIPNAGEAPNVVPAYAKVWYYVRDNNREKVDANYEWLTQIAEGAAMATQTTYKITLLTGVHEMLLNRPLQEAAQRNLEYVGAPLFSEGDHAFARELQSSLGLEPSGYPTEVEPLADHILPTQGGSTDVAEVSRLAPGVSFFVATAGLNLPWHSWATSSSHGRAGAAKGAVVAAKAMAMTALDFLQDADLRQRAKAEFDAQMAGHPYESPIPVGQKPLLPDD
jgi:aminobenzoyl-glutamate utilization protein B